MNKLLAGVVVMGSVALAGCSSTQGGKLVLEEEYRPLTRDQVILGIQECESSGARPVLQRATVKIGGKATAVVIDVTCSPRYDATSQFERGYRTGYDQSVDRYNDRSRYR
jgi:hypothetical protein